MNIIPGPNNQLTSQSYQPPIQIPPPGANVIVQDEAARLALDATAYEGMGILQLEPSSSLYIPHDGYWYMISSGEGAYPTLYASDIQNDSDVDGTTIQDALNILSSGSSGGTVAPIELTYSSSIETDASIGSTYDIYAEGNFTLENPTNPTDGKKIEWRIVATGSNVDMSIGDKFVKTNDSDIEFPYTITIDTELIMMSEYKQRSDLWRIFAFVPNNPI